MYGHSCRVVGRGGVGPLRFGGASLCWGRSVTTHTHRSVGIPRAPDVGVVRVVPPGVRVGAWVVCGGGVVGGEEGVGAVYHPVVCGRVVGGGGEGVVQIVHEGHVRGGGWLLLVGSGDVPRDVVPEVAQGGHPGYPCFPLPLFGAVGGGVGWGVGHVGLVVAGAALGAHPPRHGVSDQVSPPVDGGHTDPAPRGGRALAVWGGAGGALVSGDVEEGVEEEVSDAFPQGGRLDQGGRPDGGAGAGGAEVQQNVLFPESPEGAAVPLRGCVGRRVRPVRRLVVRGVMGGVVWVGRGGHRCRAWGPVMGSLVAVAGGGIRGGACRRGYRRRLAGAGCRVLCPWPGLGGGGGGGVVWGWRCWWWGGRGWVLC